MKMRLYRGIHVPAEQAREVAQRIETHGISGRETGEPWFSPILNRPATAYLHEPQKWYEHRDQGPMQIGVFACGTPVGASFYATRGIETSAHVPLLIALDVDRERVTVDCRDLLCPLFQRGVTHESVQRALLEVYGEAIRPWMRQAAASRDDRDPIALANLAAYDPAVVCSHHKNRLLVEGRYQTRTRSSFFVDGPLAPAEIVGVHFLRGDRTCPEPDLRLSDVVRRSAA